MDGESVLLLVFLPSRIAVYAREHWEDIVTSPDDQKYVSGLIQTALHHSGIDVHALFRTLSSINLGPLFAGETQWLEVGEGAPIHLLTGFLPISNPEP